MTQPLLQAADLRGAARLTTDAVAGLASLVEAMQARITSVPKRPGFGTAATADETTPDLPGMADGASRVATRWVGADAEALFGWLEPALAASDPHQAPHAEREALVAALNGVLGDHLAARDNPLAITMAFRHAGRPLPLERLALRSRLHDATPKLLLLLHDLCMNDLQWRRGNHDHGEALARDLGYTPVHLHYNSGLSVSTNGRILASLMERLYDAWPVPIARQVLLAHGMGGLVARSALHHAPLLQRGALRWPTRVNDLVCLGTPHQGAPLDRAGHGIEVLLGATPYAAPLARLAKIRSAGINDLRLGNIVSAPSGDNGTHRCAQVGLPDGTRCFAIAASLGPTAADAKGRSLSDGLLPVASALGQHPEPDRHLAFAADRKAVIPDTGHLDLLSSAEVYRLLVQWLG